MKEQEIIEGNKLIAVFDGMLIGKLNGWMSGDIGERAYRKADGEITEVYSFEKLKYHSSWDWLMPVVEKIYAMHMKLDFKKDMDEFCEPMYRHVINTSITTPIEGLYEDIVDFIQWYNQQK